MLSFGHEPEIKKKSLIVAWQRAIFFIFFC